MRYLQNRSPADSFFYFFIQDNLYKALEIIAETLMINDEIKDLLLERKDIFTDILGQENTKEQLKSALLMGRHVIIAGSPGIGKTTLAKNVAKLLPEITVNDCGFNCLPEKPVCPECKAKKTLKKCVPTARRTARNTATTCAITCASIASARRAPSLRIRRPPSRDLPRLKRRQLGVLGRLTIDL